MIYQFRQAGRQTFHGLDAQRVGDELERIRLSNNGQLTADEVLRWAAEGDSPLHEFFTWDTEKAAREHNLSEARYLIKSVVVIEKEGDVPSPAYWNVSVSTPSATDETSEARYYQSGAVIARNPAEFNSALSVMLRQLSSAQHGLEQLRKLAPRGNKRTVDMASKDLGSAHEKLTDLVTAD